MNNNRINRRLRRKRLTALKNRARAAGINARGQVNNIAGRAKAFEDHAARQVLINRMTNWQRNLAGRQCRGRWDDYDLMDLAIFTQQKKADRVESLQGGSHGRS